MVNSAETLEFINKNISDFHQNRIKSLESLKFDAVIKRKNPYLFKAKNITSADQFVRNLVDAYLSSKEETIFGGFLRKTDNICL